MSDNILTYSIAREWLEGSVGGKKFSFRAWSGGGRGRVGGGAEVTPASYDVFRKELGQGSHHVHGGPIPTGIYVCKYIAHHAVFGECIFLQQTILSLIGVDIKGNLHLYNRSGFFIHGRGPHGSDGCVVPENSAERHRLNRAVRDAAGTVLLNVTDKGMPLPAIQTQAKRTRTA